MKLVVLAGHCGPNTWHKCRFALHVSARALPVPSGALHKGRHDLCLKEFHQAVRCLAVRKSPAIIHTLKIAGAK